MKHEWLISKLMGLGILEKEARIYCALLRARELTAMEIQGIAHVPRTKVYEITHRMLLNCMCIEKLVDGKRKYQAVEPRKFLRSLMKRRENDLLEKKKLAEEIEKVAMPKYESGAQNAGFSRIFEIVKDQPSIHERYISLLKNTRKELRSYVKPPYAHQYDAQKMEEQDSLMFEKIRKGVKVRMLYEIPKKKVEWTYDYIRKCVEKGEHARVINSVPAKMSIFDKRHAILVLADENSNPARLTMLVIEHQPLARTQSMLFDHLWKQADDYRILESFIGKNRERE